MVVEMLMPSLCTAAAAMPCRRSKVIVHCTQLLMQALQQMLDPLVAGCCWRIANALVQTGRSAADCKVPSTAPRHTKSGTTAWMNICCNMAVAACHCSSFEQVLMALLQQTASANVRWQRMETRKKLASCQFPAERQAPMLRS